MGVILTIFAFTVLCTLVAICFILIGVTILLWFGHEEPGDFVMRTVNNFLEYLCDKADETYSLIKMLIRKYSVKTRMNDIKTSENRFIFEVKRAVWNKKLLVRMFSKFKISGNEYIGKLGKGYVGPFMAPSLLLGTHTVQPIGTSIGRFI